MAGRPPIQKKSIIELIESGEREKASFSAEEYYTELKNLTEKYQELSVIFGMKNDIISNIEKGIQTINSGLLILKSPEEFDKMKKEKKERINNK